MKNTALIFIQATYASVKYFVMESSYKQNSLYDLAVVYLHVMAKLQCFPIL